MVRTPDILAHGKRTGDVASMEGDWSLFVYDLYATGSLLAILVFCTGLVYSGKFFDLGRPASWPPIIRWLWRVSWLLWLVAVLSVVVLRIQYPVEGHIVPSPTAPLEEQILQNLVVGSVVGGYILLWAWWLANVVRGSRARSRRKALNATATPQPLWLRLGRLTVVILGLIVMVVVGAACPFAIIGIELLLGHAAPH